MCVSCRQMKSKQELLRIVKNKDGEISIDTTGKASGRGAYICKDKTCFLKLKKQKSLDRVFGCSVQDEIYTQLESEILNIE